MKKQLLILALIFYIISIPGFVFSSSSPELKIWKVNPFTRCPICGEYFTIGENHNLGSLEIYEAYFQDNQYNLNFFGPIGTTITLFGAKEFATRAGFLTVIKTDEYPVHISDLENFPLNNWTDIPRAGRISGSYRAYYHPSPNFGKWVSSVKWGNWKFPETIEK
jgi:hypothetical protein